MREPGNFVGGTPLDTGEPHAVDGCRFLEIFGDAADRALTGTGLQVEDPCVSAAPEWTGERHLPLIGSWPA